MQGHIQHQLRDDNWDGHHRGDDCEYRGLPRERGGDYSSNIFLHKDFNIEPNIPSSTPSVSETLDFVFTDILTKPKACTTHPLALLYNLVLTLTLYPGINSKYNGVPFWKVFGMGHKPILNIYSKYKQGSKIYFKIIYDYAVHSSQHIPLNPRHNYSARRFILQP